MNMTVDHGTVFQRFSAFRVELEPILTELAALSDFCSKVPGNRDMHEQLRRAIYHLELTLDYLTPLADEKDRPLALPAG